MKINLYIFYLLKQIFKALTVEKLLPTVRRNIEFSTEKHSICAEKHRIFHGEAQFLYGEASYVCMEQPILHGAAIDLHGEQPEVHGAGQFPRSSNRFLRRKRVPCGPP